MTAKWLPDDAALDALARELPVPARDEARVEHERTSVLAQAAGRPQQSPRSPWLAVAVAGAALAAAAAIVLWLVVRQAAPAEPKQTIAGIGPATFEETGPWPDFVVRVRDGRVAIRVTPLAPGERFRAVTDDAEVEIRGTRFVVAAAHDRIASVEVSEGRVEVRWAHDPPVFVAAGERWEPPRTAKRDDLSPVAPASPGTASGSATATASIDQPPAPPVKPRATGAPRPARVTGTPGASSTSGAATPDTVKPAAVTAVASPGETEFRAGVAQLRGNDVSAAQRSFTAACTAARGSALAEDACFWVGAAAKRANDLATARIALAKFLADYPRSARANEAAALLGWLLYDGGDLEGAESQFARAAQDRVAVVRDSAQRGLEAIRRKRAAP